MIREREYYANRNEFPFYSTRNRIILMLHCCCLNILYILDNPELVIVSWFLWHVWRNPHSIKTKKTEFLTPTNSIVWRPGGPDQSFVCCWKILLKIPCDLSPPTTNFGRGDKRIWWVFLTYRLAFWCFVFRFFTLNN
jgi:hypothetical protein